MNLVEGDEVLVPLLALDWVGRGGNGGDMIIMSMCELLTRCATNKN